jgi:hypothetical protein
VGRRDTRKRPVGADGEAVDSLHRASPARQRAQTVLLLFASAPSVFGPAIPFAWVS